MCPPPSSSAANCMLWGIHNTKLVSILQCVCGVRDSCHHYTNEPALHVILWVRGHMTLEEVGKKWNALISLLTKWVHM